MTGSVFGDFPMTLLTLFPPRRLRSCAAALTLVAAWVCAGCGSKDARVFTVRGVVRAPYAEGAITIQHEEIPGFMPAMTMPFYADVAEVRDLKPGDQVEFEFRVGEQSRARKFRKTGTAPIAKADSNAGGSRADAGSRRLREGERVPPFRLIDQDQRPLTEDNLRGRHTIVSFVFTRCPVPEFCPLIAKKLQAVQAQLEQPGATGERVQLLTITIDPDYDRPEILKAYGKSLGANFERWRFATGTRDEVEKLARSFAVRIERNAASLDHALATALIGPDATVVEIWRGNAWKPEEVVARIADPTPTGR